MGRKKKEEKDKKKKLSLSINNSVIDIVDEYIVGKNLTRSKLVEELWQQYLKTN